MTKAIKSIGKLLSPAFALGSALFGKKPKTPEMPKPIPLADPDDPATKLASRKKLQERAQRGREGTIFGAYGGSNLGGTA
jgi:hypothetical protein